MTIAPLERAAEALKAGFKDQGVDLNRVQIERILRSVLGAVREPSEPMIDEAMEVMQAVHAGESAIGLADDTAQVWRIMIDALLEEG